MFLNILKLYDVLMFSFLIRDFLLIVWCIFLVRLCSSSVLGLSFVELVLVSLWFCFVIVLDLCRVCKFIFVVWLRCVASMGNALCIFVPLLLWFYDD